MQAAQATLRQSVCSTAKVGSVSSMQAAQATLRQRCVVLLLALSLRDASRTGYAEERAASICSVRLAADASRTGYAEAKMSEKWKPSIIVDASRTGYAEAKIQVCESVVSV